MKKCDFEQAVELNKKIKRLTPLFEALNDDMIGKTVHIKVGNNDCSVIQNTEIPVGSSLYKAILSHIKKELEEAKEDFAMLGGYDNLSHVNVVELVQSIRKFSADHPAFCDTCPALSKCNDSDDPCYKIMEAFLRGE